MGLYSRYVRPRLLDATLGEKATGAIRDRVCAGLTGDVLEIGYGSGRNLPHLPPAVTGVWAVEPSTGALRLAAGRRDSAAVPVTVAAADARDLPFPDDRFDSALCTWVLCGVPDAHLALAEVARVLKPGAALHLVEHGLSPDAGVAGWQRRSNRLNLAIAGCRLDTDVAHLLAASPLTVSALDTYYEPGSPRPAGFMYEGRATA
ncbi:class I SAM-dependent methyltransferase [Blastococcus sp. URHD0036]|uniref:class I SAM-dependent methyltransferase n=1 Tax=Blastococcus sp. URHD0036 TaxID=1380356 RepID=UPI000497C4F8|nr:class I SAM-dependent methyltransferase [Blastococcus sp. URHD0036]